MEITLYYFKIPFWRAEVTRLALFIGDIPFNDYRVEGKEIDDLKATGLLPNNQIAPFKQLPVLDVDGKIIAQTGAIARYCGKLSGLYPKDNDFEAAKIDQIIDEVHPSKKIIIFVEFRRCWYYGEGFISSIK